MVDSTFSQIHLCTFVHAQLSLCKYSAFWTVSIFNLMMSQSEFGRNYRAWNIWTWRKKSLKKFKKTVTTGHHGVISAMDTKKKGWHIISSNNEQKQEPARQNLLKSKLWNDRSTSCYQIKAKWSGQSSCVEHEKSFICSANFKKMDQKKKREKKLECLEDNWSQIVKLHRINLWNWNYLQFLF